MVRHGSDDYHEHWTRAPVFKVDTALVSMMHATSGDGKPLQPIADATELYLAVAQAAERLSLVSKCWGELESAGYFKEVEGSSSTPLGRDSSQAATLDSQLAQGWEKPQALMHIGGGPLHDEGLVRAGLLQRDVGEHKRDMSHEEAYTVITFQLAEALFVGRHLKVIACPVASGY
jgi:hypothetical protein